MDPVLRQQLNEIHQSDLLAEAEERRQAAQLPERHSMRARAGHFFVMLGEALIRTSRVKTVAVPPRTSPQQMDVACVRAAAPCPRGESRVCLGTVMHPCMRDPLAHVAAR